MFMDLLGAIWARFGLSTLGLEPHPVEIFEVLFFQPDPQFDISNTSFLHLTFSRSLELQLHSICNPQST